LIFEILFGFRLLPSFGALHAVASPAKFQLTLYSVAKMQGVLCFVVWRQYKRFFFKSQAF
jgi:hypothetical protein